MLANLTFVAHRAIDVADLQRETNQFVSVNKCKYIIDDRHIGFP
jgi:hypothetical protein